MSKEIVPSNISLSSGPSKSWNVNWNTTVKVTVSDIQGRSWDSSAANLAKLILEQGNWEWSSNIVQSWLDIILSLELDPEIFLSLMNTQVWFEEAVKKSQELRSENIELQALVEKLRQQIEVLQNWAPYMLTEFTVEINSHPKSRICLILSKKLNHDQLRNLQTDYQQTEIQNLKHWNFYQKYLKYESFQTKWK